MMFLVPSIKKPKKIKNIEKKYKNPIFVLPPISWCIQPQWTINELFKLTFSDKMII